MHAQSCPTLRDPMDCSLPASSVHGIFQAKILHWVAIFFNPEYRPNPGIKPVSPVLLLWQADSLRLASPRSPKWNHTLCTLFCLAFFTQHNWDSSILLHVSLVHSFLFYPPIDGFACLQFLTITNKAVTDMNKWTSHESVFGPIFPFLPGKI